MYSTNNSQNVYTLQSDVGQEISVRSSVKGNQADVLSDQVMWLDMRLPDYKNLHD